MYLQPDQNLGFDWGVIGSIGGTIIDMFGSDWPKPLPPPLPYPRAEVERLFQTQPSVRNAVATIIRRQGHTANFLGRELRESDLTDLDTFTSLAIWFANGTGDDLSKDEALIRQTIEQGIQMLPAPTPPEPQPAPTGNGNGMAAVTGAVDWGTLGVAAAAVAIAFGLGVFDGGR